MTQALHSGSHVRCAAARISTTPSLTDASQPGEKKAFARTAMFDILGVGVVVPTNDPSFTDSCSAVLSTEGQIRDALAAVLDASPPHLREGFLTALSEHPIVSGILARIERYQSQAEQKAAGLEIGISGHHTIFGSALCKELAEIYATILRELPLELVSACRQWGHAQAQARELILERTWHAIVGRQDWPRPTGFDRVISGFLEGCPLLCDSLMNSEVRLAAWLVTVQTLREKSTSPVFIAAALLKRDDLTSADVAGAAAMLKEHGLDAWSESLWKSSPGLESRIVDEIWTDQETRPKQVHFVAGVPSQVTISVKQALEYWSRYIAALPLESVTIHSRATDFSEHPVRSHKLVEVGHTPLAHFIHRIELDFHKANARQIEGSLRAAINLLSAMVKGSDWHDNSRQHLVTLALLNCGSSDCGRMLKSEAQRIPWRLTRSSPYEFAFHYSPK